MSKRNFLSKEIIIVILLNCAMIENFITIFCAFLEVNSLWCNYISRITYVISAILLIFFIFKKQKVLFFKIFLFLFIAGIFIITYYKFVEIREETYSAIIVFFSNCFLVFAYIDETVNYKKIMKLFKPFIILSIPFLIFSLLTNNLDSEYMTISYQILPCIILSLLFAYKYKEKIFYFPCIFLVIGLLILGCRGPILITVLFFLYLYLFNSKTFMVGAVRFIFILFITIIFLNFYPFILATLFPNSRLNNFVNVGIIFDEVRMNLTKYGLQKILENPLKINGLLFDRYYYSYEFAGTDVLGFYVTEEMFTGLYAHNLWLELGLDFGLMVGSIIFIIVVFAAIAAYFKCEDKDVKIFFVVLMACGFLPLMVSGSFLINPWFWALMSLILSIYRNHGYYKNQKTKKILS